MIKKLIITTLLLVGADYAFNGGAYVHMFAAKIHLWSAESSRNVNSSIFAA